MSHSRNRDWEAEVTAKREVSEEHWRDDEESYTEDSAL